MRAVAMWGGTDCGRLRARNEDAVAWDGEARWAVVVDGMGGHHAGDVASALVVDAVERVVGRTGVRDVRRLLRRAVVEANRCVFTAASEDAARQGMGATLVLAKFTPRRLVVAHVGDSRLYRLRDHRLEQLTGDHSLVQELVDSGLMSVEEARCSPHRNVVTRAIGSGPEIEVEVGSYYSRRGDRILLCSDGLSDLVAEGAIAECLDKKAPPEAVGRQLVAMANANGGTDNIAVVVADVV